MLHHHNNQKYTAKREYTCGVFVCVYVCLCGDVVFVCCTSVCVCFFRFVIVCLCNFQFENCVCVWFFFVCLMMAVCEYFRCEMKKKMYRKKSVGFLIWADIFFEIERERQIDRQREYQPKKYI